MFKRTRATQSLSFLRSVLDLASLRENLKTTTGAQAGSERRRRRREATWLRKWVAKPKMIIAQRRVGLRIRAWSSSNDHCTCSHRWYGVGGMLVRLLVRLHTPSRLRFASSTVDDFRTSRDVQRCSGSYVSRTSGALFFNSDARRSTRVVRNCRRDIERLQRCLLRRHLYCTPGHHSLRWRSFRWLILRNFATALCSLVVRCGMN